ncbi:MAG: GatB/YqeY domain-containing protein [Oligoflexia bacterium]|nr:GatB/YqeY domain-containing protein [Oligoflexia bacterium]
MDTTNFLEKISNDIKEAMKAQEKERLSALRGLKSSLIENKTAAKPRAEIEVIVAYCKKIKDSIEAFPANDPNREKLHREVEFLKVYMPQELSEEDVRKIIATIISSSPQKPNLGMVMKELSPQIKGRFDGKLANQIVQEMLAK